MSVEHKVVKVIETKTGDVVTKFYIDRQLEYLILKNSVEEIEEEKRTR